MSEFENLVVTFLDKHKEDIINIYMKERKNANNEDGAVFINLENIEDIQVSYIILSKISDDVKKVIIEKINKRKGLNYVYLVCHNTTDTEILEIQLKVDKKILEELEKKNKEGIAVI